MPFEENKNKMQFKHQNVSSSGSIPKVQSQETISEEMNEKNNKKVEQITGSLLKTNHQKNPSKILDQFKEKQNILKNLLEDLELIQNEGEKYKAENKKLKKIIRDLNSNLIANGVINGDHQTKIASNNIDKQERALLEDAGPLSYRNESNLVKKLEREKSILSDTITNQVGAKNMNK